jgi:small-conductance mechanosensitive channel
MSLPSVTDAAGRVVLGNTLERWAIALAIVLIAVLLACLLLRVGTRLLRRFASRTRSRIDDALVETLATTRLWLVAMASSGLAASTLDLRPGVLRIVHGVAVVAFFLQAGLWGARLLHIWIAGARESARRHNSAALSSFGAIAFIARVTLWAVVALVAFDNLGINVSALVAGLGIGGIAIGLALQNILGDLFASLSIVLDKPFVVGDFIVADTFMGTVENIGVKTTRVRSLDGELLVFANGDLTKSRLRNYRDQRERRVQFGFGVMPGTPAERVEPIAGLLRKIVEAQPRVRFDRAHFKGIGTASLDFEVVYYVLTADYNAYMDIQQAINLAILRLLTERQIEFAMPARGVRIEKSPPDAAAA